MPLFDLPDELLEMILLKLPCKQIIELSQGFNKIHNLCVRSNLIERRKCKGFPRKSGRCKNYDLQNIFINYNNIKYFTMSLLTVHNDPLDIILNTLYELNYDLIRGDLLYLDGIDNKGNMCIFDGCELVDLKDYCTRLPLEYTNINNNVHLRYWDVLWDGPGYNLGINFNHTSIKHEMIDNIKVDDNELLTTFTFNNVEYTIVYYYCFLTTHYVENFKNIIVQNNTLQLFTEDPSTNILYLCNNY